MKCQSWNPAGKPGIAEAVSGALAEGRYFGLVRVSMTPLSSSEIVHPEMIIEAARNKLKTDSCDEIRKSHIAWSIVMLANVAKLSMTL